MNKVTTRTKIEKGYSAMLDVGIDKLAVDLDDELFVEVVGVGFGMLSEYVDGLAAARVKKHPGAAEPKSGRVVAGARSIGENQVVSSELSIEL